MDGRRGRSDRTGSSYGGFASNHSKAIHDRDSHRPYDDRPGSPRGGGGRGFGSGRGRGRGRYDGRGRGSLRDVSTTGNLAATNPVHAERFEPSPTSAMARRPVERPSTSPDPSGYESGEIMPQRPLVHPRRSSTSNVEPPNHSETSKAGGRGGAGSVDGRGPRFETRGRDGSSGRFFSAANRQRSGGRGSDSYSSGRPGEPRFQEPPRAIEIARSNNNNNNNNEPPFIPAHDRGGPRDRPRDMMTGNNPRSMHPDSGRGGLALVHDAKRPREDQGYPVDHDEKRFRVKEYGPRSGLEDGNSPDGPPLDSKSRPGANFQRFDHDRGHSDPRTSLGSLRRDDRRGRLDHSAGLASNSDRLETHLMSGSSRYNDASTIGPDAEIGHSERMGMDARPGRYGEVDRVRLDSRPTRILPVDSDRRGVDDGQGRLGDTNRFQQDSGPSRYIQAERKGTDSEPGRFIHSGVSPARYHDSDRVPLDNGQGRYRDAERLHTDSGPNRFYDSDRRGFDRGPGRQGDMDRFSQEGGPGRYIDSDRRVPESGPGRSVDIDRFALDSVPGRYIDSDRRGPDSGPGRHYDVDRFPSDVGSGRYIDSDRRVPDSEIPAGRQHDIDRFPLDSGPNRYADSDHRGPDRGPGRYEASDRLGLESGPTRYFESDHRGSTAGKGRYSDPEPKRSDMVSIRYRDSEHCDTGQERFIDSERGRGPDSGPPRRFDVDRSHPESAPVRYIDSDLSGVGSFHDSVRTAPGDGPGRYNDTYRRRVDSGPGSNPDSHFLIANQDRGQGRTKDLNRAGLDRELTVGRNKNFDMIGSDSGFQRFTTNNSIRGGPDSGPGPYNDNAHVTADIRTSRFDAPDRSELDTRQGRYNDSDRSTHMLGTSRYDDSRNHAGTVHEPPAPSMRNIHRMPSSNIDDPRGGPLSSMTRRDNDMAGKISYRDDQRDAGFKDEGLHHPNSRFEASTESRYRGARPSEDIPPQRPRPPPPMDSRGRDAPIDLPHRDRDTPIHDMRGATEHKRDMDVRANSPVHDRHIRPTPSANDDQTRDYRGGPQAPIEATGKPNWVAPPSSSQGHIHTSGPPRRNMGRQSMEAGPKYREETRQPDMPFSDSSRPLDGRGFYADRGRGRGRGGRGQFSRGGGGFVQGRRRYEDGQPGLVGQSPTVLNDRESTSDPSKYQENDAEKKPTSDAVPPSGDSMEQDVVKEVQESNPMPEQSQPQDVVIPPSSDADAKPEVDHAVKPESIEVETAGEGEAAIVPRPISPPPPGQPSGVVLALARLADLEAQMEYAYAKHMLLVRRQKELQLQTKVLEELPVGIDAFREELDALKSDTSLEVVQ